MTYNSSKSKVYFFYQYSSFALANRSFLKDFIAQIFKKEHKKLESLNFVFCSDKDLLIINREYLQHDYYTDIITFDLSVSEEIGAEVYISIERVKENAKKLKIPFNQELLRVIFHGVLHLCGYKDKNKKDILEIRNKEDKYLKQYTNLVSREKK